MVELPSSQTFYRRLPSADYLLGTTLCNHLGLMKNPNAIARWSAILFTLLATVAVMAQQTDSSLRRSSDLQLRRIPFANFWTGALA